MRMSADGVYSYTNVQHFLWRFMMLVVVAFVIVTPIRLFVAQPFIVSGTSMLPTLEKGEYLVIDQLTYRSHLPQRGDVVIFRYPLDPAVFFVKRVIGLPGEGIEVRDGNVILTINGTTTTLNEPYLTNDQRGKDMKFMQLDAGEYFVMGDNRDESADSRTWGPLQRRHIIGRALALLLPIGEARMFPGKYEFDTQ